MRCVWNKVCWAQQAAPRGHPQGVSQRRSPRIERRGYKSPVWGALRANRPLDGKLLALVGAFVGTPLVGVLPGRCVQRREARVGGLGNSRPAFQGRVVQSVSPRQRFHGWKFFWAFFFFLWITGCALPGSAQTARRVTLPNGARLILRPEPTTDVLAITMLARMPEDATPQEAATGELVANALFYGSLNRSFETVVASVMQVGGSLETLYTPEYVAVTCVTMPEQMDEAVYLLCEALKNADFSPDALERARRFLLKEQQKRETQPFEKAYAACRAQMREIPPPSMSLFRQVTPESARAYFRSRYVPERAVFSLVGRFQPEQVQRAFENYLVDYNRQPSRFPRFPPAPPLLRSSAQTAVVSAPGSVAYALVGTAAPDVAHPDYPAFTVLRALLGGGHAARLFRRLRDSQGIGYNVGALYRADRGDPLVAYLQWDTRRASDKGSAVPTPQQAIPLLQAQLDSLRADPPTEAEVARARRVAIGQDALRHERAYERAFLLGWYEVMGNGYDFDTEFPRRLAAVTRADVLRVAETYLATRATVLSLPK